MGRSLVVYFLLLLVPLAVLPVATHRLLSEEMSRGRQLGRSFLQERADRLAADLVSGRCTEESVCRQPDGLLVGFVDAAGAPLGAALPADGRCFGEASISGSVPPRCLRVMWGGAVDQGKARARKLWQGELAVYCGCGFLALAGLVLIAFDLLRSRRAARERLEYVADFSHRLKTPLTAISLCAELTASGRLDAAKTRECHETIAAESAKVDGLIDEVMAYVKESRRG